jgi:hypothetical protein
MCREIAADAPIFAIIVTVDEPCLFNQRAAGPIEQATSRYMKRGRGLLLAALLTMARKSTAIAFCSLALA